MIRAQIYLTEHERQKLGAFSAETGRSQSELIRQAIDQFIDAHLNKKSGARHALKAAKGLWAERKNLPDFTSIRREFDRHEKYKKNKDKK